MSKNKVAVSKIERRIKSIDEWIKDEGRGCKKAQAHLQVGTTERIYWHYGYAVALRDVLRLLKNEEAKLN